MDLSRRLFVTLSATAPLALQAQEPSSRRFTADESVKALMDGNERFHTGKTLSPHNTPADFSSMASYQAPKAAIIACADSRVPPEILFDQGVGDLFVIRVAGNVVNQAEAGVIGSMAFAALVLGTPLIMVLGHSHCGAVEAALNGNKGSLPASIRQLVAMVQTGSEKDLARAIAANVRAGVAQAKTVEPDVTRLVRKDQVKIVGAVYDLASGCVSLLG